MVKAAGFWAAARKQGRQSASDASLDADMILAAQAVELSAGGGAIVATTKCPASCLVLRGALVAGDHLISRKKRAI
jgi:hypothetical protein